MWMAIMAWAALCFGACSGDQPAQGPHDGGNNDGSNNDGSNNRGDGSAMGMPDFAQESGDLATVYQAVTINFDNVATGTNVTTQYSAHATFSSDPGCACQASSDAGLAASPPNYIFTFYTCPTGATASVFVDFAKPVRGLSFKGIGVNDTGKVATINVVTAAGKQSLDMMGQGNYAVPVKVDLSSFSDVTRLEIVHPNDFEGMGFDDFAFQFPQ
jgi:hypothetical protein